MKHKRALWPIVGALALSGSLASHADVRLRDVLYDPSEVYRLPAYAGYATDIEFESGEHFVGLGTGDLQGLVYRAQENHLFIKPRAADVNTDITVLTDRRVYHFDYVSIDHPPDASHADLLYALRFLYPSGGSEAMPAAKTASAPRRTGTSPSAPAPRRMNLNYGYCGSRQLRPLAAWDDSAQTHLRFAPGQDMPALFLSDADGSESLLNFHIEKEDVVIHRVVRRLILRRGKLMSCIVNRSYRAAGVATTATGTIDPRIHREMRGDD